MKLSTIIMIAFAGLVAAHGKCCAPGCGYCKDEQCGELGDNDCSNNSFYVTCCDESMLAQRHLSRFYKATKQEEVTTKAE